MNSWIAHVKSVAEKDKVPYPVALIKARDTYKKKDDVPSTPKPSPKKSKRQQKPVLAPVAEVEDVKPVTVGRKNLKK